MRKRALTLCLLLWGVARAETVQGTVLDAGTRQPIRKAAVTLTSLAQDRSYAVAITDSAGRFALDKIPKGRYRILAARNGYLSIPYGALTPQRGGTALLVDEGESRTGLVLLLAQSNMVSGAVTDPEGDGVAGVQVGLYRKQWDRGKPMLRQVAAAITDSQGRYHVAAVLNGEYTVCALAQSARPTRIRPVATLGESLPPDGLVSQTYSAPVVIAGNDVSGIDFHLNYAAQVSVHGTISGIPDDVRNVTVSLDSDLISGGASSGYRGVRPDHSFQVSGITAGTYRLKVRAGSRRATIKLNLTAADTEVNVALSPGVPLSGTVLVEGPGAERLKNLRVNLSAAEENGPPLRADVEDGEFEFDEVPPGIWDIGVSPLPRDAYIKTMRLGAKDVLLEDMEIAPGTKGPLAIVISTQAAKLEGTVEPAGPATLVAAPLGKFAGQSSFFATANTDEKGHFTLYGLNPGTYRVYAFRDIEPQAWQDPKLLPRYESQSKTVELAEGATGTISLPLIGVLLP